MGWKPPSAPVHTDLGEIPGVRELSTEEEKTLDRNAPDRDGQATVRKRLSEREENIAEALIDDYGQDAMDIGNMLDDWMEDEQAAVPFDIFSDTIKTDIYLHLKAIGSSHDAIMTHDIACKRILKPSMFFYGINMDDTLPSGFYVVITSIQRWYKDRDIDNSDLSDFVMPLFLTKVNDSTYTAKDMSPSQIRRELAKSGFVERHEVAGL